MFFTSVLLKDKNLINSQKGKNTYVSIRQNYGQIKILFLVDKLNNNTLSIFYSFSEKIGDQYKVLFEIYHNEKRLKDISRNQEGYDYFVIIPNLKSFNYESESSFYDAVRTIPKRKIIILNFSQTSYSETYLQIYQDFENDLYDCLCEGREHILKYKKIVFKHSSSNFFYWYPAILNGIRTFCHDYSLAYERYDQLSLENNIEDGDLIIVSDDNDLIDLLKVVTHKNLKIGENIGIISYDDTPLKRHLEITVMSTNISQIGMYAATLIQSRIKGNLKNTANLIVRNSLKR